MTRITLEIELFTALNGFAGAVKTQNLMGAPFLFELGGGKLMRYLSQL